MLLLLLSLLLGGCVSSYSPPGPVVPLFREKGELSVGANVRPIFPTRGSNAYIAVAPSKASRAYVQGSMARYDGQINADHSERRMHEKNHTTQIEAAAGWGWNRGRMGLELFAGAGYGRSDANACHRNTDINGSYGTDCLLWVNSKSSFVRPFVQGHFGFHHRFGTVAGGLRLSAVRYAFESLMGEPSDRTATAVTLEPYVGSSFGFPWGKLEFTTMIPLVVSSPDVHYTRNYTEYYQTPMEETFTARLVETAMPRFTVGIRADLHELWRN